MGSRCMLKLVEIENFKSFNGLHAYGPLEKFTAVVGPNGSGKSNFMDAISFVMGEKPQNLRVQRSDHLINSAAGNGPASSPARVTATIVLEDDMHVKFTRSIVNHSSLYRINDRRVSVDEYLEELKEININVRAKNFLVFQGAVENIALRNPKEIALLFEEMCGSWELKEEYDKLNAQLQEANNQVQELSKAKKGTYVENRGAKLAVADAKTYQKLVDSLKETKIMYSLFKLYFCEHQITNYSNDLVNAKEELKQSNDQMANSEKILQKKKRDYAWMSEEVFNLEKEIRKQESERNRNQPQFARASERLTHNEKKLEGSKKLLSRARDEEKAHTEELSRLQQELDDVEQAFSTLDESQPNDGIDQEQEHEQIRRYNELKEQSKRESARQVQELDLAYREQKVDQNRLQNLVRLCDETDRKLKQRRDELENSQREFDKLSQLNGDIKEKLTDLKAKAENFDGNGALLRSNIAQIETELTKTSQMLSHARYNRHSERRQKQKQETVSRLKEKFPMVFERISTLCQAVDKRYITAIAKVIGPKMDAIVVDCDDTARKCISYLEEEHIEAETFLPLSYLKVSTAPMRGIHDPPGVRSLYDVIRYDDKRIEKAIRYVTQNAYVCETAEHARLVAYGLGGERYSNAVSLNGRYFKKDGTISGVSQELAKIIVEWEAKGVEELLRNKERLIEELREAKRMLSEMGTLQLIQINRRGFETRLAYVKKELKNTKEKNKDLNNDITHLEKKLADYSRSCDEAKEALRLKSERVREIENIVNQREDAIFADFCALVGVANVREFEEIRLRSRGERQSKRLEYENLKIRIEQRLDFERSRIAQIRAGVERWQRTVDEDETDLTTCQAELQSIVQKIEEDTGKLNEAKAQFLIKRNELDTLDEEIVKMRREAGKADKRSEQVRKNIAALEANIYQKKHDRHLILVRTKMDDLTIPMEEGDMNDIDDSLELETASLASKSVSLDSQASTQPNSETIFCREENIVVDYSTLAKNLKNLTDLNEIRNKEAEIQDEMQQLIIKIRAIKNPNLRADEEYAHVRDKLRKTNQELNDAQEVANGLKEQFEDVKKRRLDKFRACFDFVSREIDSMYKRLTGKESAQAYLVAENGDEPYLGGITYSCVAPGKRYQSMGFLSGGEKTVAALALLFAIHSQNHAPFFILDEIDGALDNNNIDGVARFMCSVKDVLQLIVISLKKQFYRHADTLVGVCPDPNEAVLSTRMFLVDLKEYDERNWLEGIDEDSEEF